MIAYIGSIGKPLGTTAIVEVAFKNGSKGRTLLHQSDPLTSRIVFGPLRDILERADLGLISSRDQEMAYDHIALLIEEAHRMRELLGGKHMNAVNPNNHNRKKSSILPGIDAPNLPRLDPEAITLDNHAGDITRVIEALTRIQGTSNHSAESNVKATWNKSDDAHFEKHSVVSDDFNNHPDEERIKQQEEAAQTRIHLAKMNLARNATSKLKLVSVDAANGAQASFLGIVKILSQDLHENTYHEQRIARALINLLASGWGEEEWTSSSERGWMLNLPAVPREAVLLSTVAIVQAASTFLDQPINSMSEHDANTLHCCQMALRGLESSHYPISEDLSDIDDPVSKVLADIPWELYLMQLRDLKFGKTIDINWLTDVKALALAHRTYLDALNRMGETEDDRRQYQATINSFKNKQVPCPKNTSIRTIWNQAIRNINTPCTDPVITLVNNNCTCGRVTTQQIAQALLRPTNLRICPHCSRLLVHKNARLKIWS